MTSNIQFLGRRFDFKFNENAIYRLHFVDATHLEVTVVADPAYPQGTLNHFETNVTEIRPGVYMITWIEPATRNTVPHVDDFDNGISFTNITDINSKGFWRLEGTIQPVDDSAHA